MGAIMVIGAEADAATDAAARLRPRLQAPLPNPAEEVALIRLDPVEEGRTRRA
jgi:hypothetical protein